MCRIQAKCQYIEVVGIGEYEIRKNVELAFKNLQLKERFNLYIKQRPHIRSMMYVPINCAIVVELFREHKGKPPQTLTEVYTALTNTLLQRHEKKTKEKTSVGMPNTGKLLEQKDQLYSMFNYAAFDMKGYLNANELFTHLTVTLLFKLTT